MVRSATATTRSKDIAEKILYSIECEMRMCPYTTLGRVKLRIRCRLQAKRASLLEKESVRSKSDGVHHALNPRVVDPRGAVDVETSR